MVTKGKVVAWRLATNAQTFVGSYTDLNHTRSSSTKDTSAMGLLEALLADFTKLQHSAHTWTHKRGRKRLMNVMLPQRPCPPQKEHWTHQSKSSSGPVSRTSAACKSMRRDSSRELISAWQASEQPCVCSCCLNMRSVTSSLAKSYVCHGLNECRTQCCSGFFLYSLDERDRKV